MNYSLENVVWLLSAMCVIMLIRLGGGCVAWLKERNTWGTKFTDFLNFYARVEMSGLDIVILVIIFGLTLWVVIASINKYFPL